jgi:hypothetical protein
VNHSHHLKDAAALNRFAITAGNANEDEQCVVAIMQQFETI